MVLSSTTKKSFEKNLAYDLLGEFFGSLQDLWIHLFRGELYIKNVRGQPKRFARAGGLMLHLRPTRRNLYIPNRMTTNNAGWTRGWFYLRNFGNRLPAFTNKVLRERPQKWN